MLTAENARKFAPTYKWAAVLTDIEARIKMRAESGYNFALLKKSDLPADELGMWARGLAQSEWATTLEVELLRAGYLIEVAPDGLSISVSWRTE